MEQTTPPNHTDRWIAIILALITLIVLLATSSDIGLTWDEPAYIAAAESYTKWIGQAVTHPADAFSPGRIEQYWEINHEHPPLDKIWSGLVWQAARFVLDDLTAHRLGNMLLTAVLVGMLYRMLAEEYGRTAGLVAAAALISLPRFFFHAHLASLDVPAAVAIFATVLVFWRGKDKPGWQGTVALGVVWGLAVATKINAVFVMPTLLVWVLLFQRRWKLILRLVGASAWAFPVFLLSWPWLYRDLPGRLWEYIRWITVDHWEIGQYYQHKFYMPPPWHFPFVMVAAVLPLAFALFALVGVARTAAEKEHRPLGVLVALNALVPLLAIAIGQSMVYDNERLFMPAFPYIAALVGIGAAWVLGRLKGWLESRSRAGLAAPLSAAVLLLVFVPHLFTAVPLYPHLLSYYGGIVGGVPGAHRLGLESTYWCETYTEALDYLNEKARPGDIVWTDPWSHDVMVYYQLHGQLRDDLNIAVPASTASLLTPDANLVVADYTRADFLVVHHRQTSYMEGGAAYSLLSWLEARKPDVQVSFRGVPLIEVYHQLP